MSIISRSPFNFKLGWGDTRSKLDPQQNISKQNESLAKLIVGLGNVGERYEETRHNIGFEVIDQYAKRNDFPTFKENKKFFCQVSERFMNGQKVILVKPTTMINLSGKSVRAISQFYGIKPEEITVIHDELDLDFGTLKRKEGGEGRSSHNGLKDISAKLNSNDYNRIRFGIKDSLLEKMDAKDFVLGKFSKEEQSKIKDLTEEALNLI